MKRHWPAKGLALTALLALSACVRLVPESRPPVGPTPVPTATPTAAPTPAPTPTPSNAAQLAIAPGPAVSSIAMQPGDAAGALSAFGASCNWLTSKDDKSGLTRPSDWQQACDRAARWSGGDARGFFSQYFETIRVGDGAAFATGYFEPEIAGSRSRISGYDVPIYKMPPELIRAWPADVPEDERDGRPPLGRYDASGNFIQYYERAEIEQGALMGRGLEIAWAADEIEFFFLQIQGSGLLRLPDNSVMRIGYAGQNGREYVGIGRVMRDRGLIGDGPGQYPGSMQGIIQYLRDYPEEGRELMRLNKSWIFFRELTTDGPLGSLGVPVRREASVAVDPNFVPYGAPVWLSVDRPVANGLWIAQDTGGAIKGANRFDTFWGNGGDAREIAGGMSARGQALIMVPKGTYARLMLER